MAFSKNSGLMDGEKLETLDQGFSSFFMGGGFFHLLVQVQKILR
jgi:hypothetical protein